MTELQLDEHPHTRNFFERVYATVELIPHGMVMSYGQIAALLGNPRGARSVGWAMSSCSEKLPWHRVVKSDGSITGGHWAELRRERLIDEGVEFLIDGRVNMETACWRPR